MWNNQIIVIKEGQLVTGREKLSKETGIPESTVERILNYLEKEHQIGQQKTTKYRLITIVNWEKYQVADNKWTTNGQQMDTYKNDKNDKNKYRADKSAEIVYQEVNDEGEPVVKRSGLKRKVSEPPYPFSQGDEIKRLLASPVKVHKIAGHYILTKKLKYENRDQFEPDLARFIHTAKSLKGYDSGKIERAFEYCRKKWPDDWVLETVVKWIAEANK